MPYKDPAKEAEKKRRWLKRNREKHLASQRLWNRSTLYNYLDTRFFKWEQVEGYDGFSVNTHVHHRLEDKGYTRDELKAIGAYYNCCPEDLICMTPSEHTTHHNKLRNTK